MLGHHYGLVAGDSLSERPSSEGNPMPVEFRQGQSPCEGESESDQCRLLYRHIIIQAVHDLGYFRRHERAAIRNFILTDWFSTICTFSDWDEDWVRKIFSSVDVLRDEVRREVTTQITRTMKLLSSMDT